MYAGVQVCICVCVCVHVEFKSQPHESFLESHLPWLLKQGLSPAQRLRDPPASVSPALGLQLYIITLSF